MAVADPRQNPNWATLSSTMQKAQLDRYNASLTSTVPPSAIAPLLPPIGTDRPPIGEYQNPIRAPAENVPANRNPFVKQPTIPGAFDWSSAPRTYDYQRPPNAATPAPGAGQPAQPSPMSILARTLGSILSNDVRYSPSFTGALNQGLRPSASDATLRDISMMGPDQTNNFASLFGPNAFASWLWSLGLLSPQGMRTRGSVQGGVRV